MSPELSIAGPLSQISR